MRRDGTGDGAPRICRLRIDRVGAGSVERHRVERGEHAHVGYDRHVVVCMAVAFGRYVNRQRNVEVRPPVAYGLGILGDLAVEHVVCGVELRVDRLNRTYAHAAAAAGAFCLEDGAFAVFNARRPVRAVLDALAAANAARLIDDRLAGAVHVHFAGARAGAHAEVFQRAAEAGADVTLCMAE